MNRWLPVTILLAMAWQNVNSRSAMRSPTNDLAGSTSELPPISPTKKELPPVQPVRKTLTFTPLDEREPAAESPSSGVSSRTLSPDMPATIDQRIAQASRSAAADGRSMSDEYVVEGDIAVSKNQYEARTTESLDGIAKRKANVGYWGKKWTDNTLPYKLANDFNGNEIAVIKAAMAEWEKYTCLKFREASSNEQNFIHIQNGVGCNSQVGMQGGQQNVNLEYNCRYKDIVIHELGHAMGFWHEQSRPDRDDYIIVNLYNMDPNQRYNMDMYGTDQIDNMNVEYDYGSIMHYGENAFSFNNQPVMEARDSWWQKKMGTMTSTSFRDLVLMNKYYGCSDHCGSTSCPNNGYMDKNCECQCLGWPIKKCGSSEPDGPGYECKDMNDRCQEWQGWGECDRNPGFMLTKCKKSCGVCDEFQAKIGH